MFHRAVDLRFLSGTSLAVTFEDGELVRTEAPTNLMLAHAVAAARAGLTQKQVAAIAGIDQSDFSKIERGIANPSVSMLERIAKAMGGSLSITIETASTH